MKGWQLSFQPLTKARILIMRSRTDGKLPRWMAWRSMMENQTSTRFSQDPEVGVKWTWILGFAASQDVVYLISEQPKVRTTHGRIGQMIDPALGLNAGQSSTTRDQLCWLFERRNEAVHPYTELEPPRVHPAGLNSSAETAKFNAVDSSRAVDIAMAMLELAAAPPYPHGRWVTRWVAEREPYHSTVIAPLHECRATGRPTQVQTTDTD